MHTFLKRSTALALVMGLGVSGAHAQSVEQNPADEEVTVLDRIFITARRTEEPIENVPGSVVVVTGEEIERSNAGDARELLLDLPNVSFTEASTPTDLDIAIRGISNNVGGNSASGPAVGVYIDGALVNPTGQTTAVNPNLFDLERVETILGPQGTAFGRGALGGAINFVTKKPTDEFEASITTELSTFENTDSFDVLGRVILNAPIIEDGLLSARFAAYGRESDGFLELINNAIDDTNEIGEFGGRLSLRSRPTDQITLDFSASYDETRYITANAATQASFDAGNPVDISGFFGNDELLERQLYNFNAEFEGTDGVFKSATSFLRTDTETDGDTDRNPIDLLRGTSDTNQTSFSQEFRFEGNEIDLGEDAGVVTFNSGISGAIADFDTRFTLDPQAAILPGILAGVQTGLAQAQAGLVQIQAGLAAAQAAAAAIIAGGGTVPPALQQQIAALQAQEIALTQTINGLQVQEAQLNGLIALTPIDPTAVEAALGASETFIEQEVESFSIFGDLRWEPTDQLEIAVGARYSRDVVSVGTFTTSTGLTGVTFPGANFQTAEKAFDGITPNATIRYQWNDNFSTYASYSTGFRAGGFNATFNGINSEFEEENIQSYEVGFRALSPDNTLSLNASLFFIDYEDIQLVVSDLVNVGGILTPDATVQNAGEARSFGAEIGVTYQPFDGLNIVAQLGLLSAEFENTVIDSDGDIVATDGQTLPNSPDTTFSIVADYEHQEPLFFDANPFIRGEYSYRSDFTNIVNSGSLVLDGFDIFNLRAGLRGESFEVSVFAENLFDEIYATGTTSAGAAGFLDAGVNLDIGERRRVGVIGTFKF
ncbi:MAG: TonB-dependent receptor [Pseudomonadota bacterium]